MNFRREKFVRFKDYTSDRSSGLCRRSRSIVSSVVGSFQKGFEKVSQGISRSPQKSLPTHQLGGRKTILDPEGEFLQKWNKIFVLACVLAVSVDPLFFYIPVINGEKMCLDLDHTLEKAVCVLRSLVDMFYILNMFFQFRTGYIHRYSRVVFGRGEVIKNPCAIAKRYLSSYFIIDILAILPLPQVLILVIIPNMDGPVAQPTKELLKVVVLAQYVPRLVRIYPLYKEVKRTSGLFTKTAWAGAAFNLFLYMLASHVVGAFWYFLAIERKDSCWQLVCKNDSLDKCLLYCDEREENSSSLPPNSCPLLDPSGIKNSKDFDFGIFLDALQPEIVETTDFPKKLLYCFWWGLRNLSAFGQNLRTSTFGGEILFAIFISILGLVLFSLLIGNLQKYLQSIQSINDRLEEMRVKRQDVEQWMSHRLLPEYLRQRIRSHERYKWQETRGIEECKLIHNLPEDIGRDVKRHLYWSLLKRVPLFEEMDDQLIDAMCDHLKTVLYTEDSFIFRERNPVDKMLFVMRGKLLSINTNGGRTGFFNSAYLTTGDFCGEELLTWAVDPTSSSIHPISTRTVKAITDVEALAFKAHDLKIVISEFRHLHSRQLRHTFRLYSAQWRIWGARFIQAAWRRYWRWKIEKSLCEEEDKPQDALGNEFGTSPSLVATFYASRFVTNALRPLRHNHPHKLPHVLLLKPSEPNFTANDH